MNQVLARLQEIFSGTKADIEQFNSMLQPVVNNAADEHERLYFHHILEEEEQRLERLEVLLPMLKHALDEGYNERQLVQLLQELNLEKFGLHNFREHLDLAMFEFKDEERQALLKSMREKTESDYLAVKDLIAQLSDKFQDQLASVQINKPSPAVNMDMKPVPEHRQIPGKRLTVGSLRNKS